MSILADKTEKAALLVLTRCLKYFDQLEKLEMTAYDAFAARNAEATIKGIIGRNGYTPKELQREVAIIHELKPKR